jgi:hypothetical protein
MYVLQCTMLVGPANGGNKVPLFFIHVCNVRMQKMLESDCDTVQCCCCCLECCSCHMLQDLCVKAAVISAVTKERLCVAKWT